MWEAAGKRQFLQDGLLVVDVSEKAQIISYSTVQYSIV